MAGQLLEDQNVGIEDEVRDIGEGLQGTSGMSPATLIRWSGVATMVGAAYIPLYPLLHPSTDAEGYASAAWVPVHLLAYLSMVLLMFGLVGLVARQLRAAGRLGVLGFCLAFVGTALVIMEAREHTFVMPLLALQAAGERPDPPGLWFLVLSSALFGLGYVVLGVASARARVIPPAAAVLFAVGAPILAFSPPIGIRAVELLAGASFGAGMLWLGYALFRGGGHTSQE